ncbi:MAG: citrulline utilization hydrolase CtlX [Flavobacteriaceae bacterium]
MHQTTNTILMIRPINFRMNEETAVNNYYQKQGENTLPEAIKTKAVQEFDALVEKLKNVGVQVIVVPDTDQHDTPDAVFPNNWVSFHENGTVGLYPMFAENRRLERREEVLLEIEKQGFVITNIIDYTEAEEEGVFLEGTGSLVLDRINRKAYCALSPRADEDLLIEFCEDFEYMPVIFTANQTVSGTRRPIYHTNVMMAIGETFTVVCLNSIDDKKERKNLIKHLTEDGKDIINITEAQVSHFAGNMLQVIGANNTRFLVMSELAYKTLTPQQLQQLEKHTQILYSNLSTIETCGGGSARCMMAEVFLPKSK